METKPRIYIAGKVTGEKIQDCTMKFGAWQKAIEAMGFEVVNPLEVVNDWRTPWDEAMKLCVAELIKCDAVFMLPCWTNSKGAKVEKQLADDLGISVYMDANEMKAEILALCQK
jgi:hypothetical protein